VAVVGITVRAKASRPYLRGVVLDEPTPGSPALTFEYTSNAGQSLADQVHGLANALRTSLKAVTSGVEAVIIREADDGPRGGLTAGRKARVRGEGAALDAARSITAKVELMNGPAIGRACGGNLASAEAAASALVEAVWVEAGSAAIAARSL
jgi:hypothetical protein